MTNILELMLAMCLAVILIMSLPFFLITTKIDVVNEKGLKVLS
jgi:GTPase